MKTEAKNSLNITKNVSDNKIVVCEIELSILDYVLENWNFNNSESELRNISGLGLHFKEK